MKNALLKITAILSLILFAGACSTDEASIVNDQTGKDAPKVLARESVWANRLGKINTDGTVAFMVDPNDVKAEFQAMLKEQGVFNELQEVYFDLKTNPNDDKDSTYTLIASDGDGLSIGVMLKPASKLSNELVIDDPIFGGGNGVKGTTCTGCGWGCHLRYIKLDGKKVFYCDESGCGLLCVKNQS